MIGIIIYLLIFYFILFYILNRFINCLLSMGYFII